MPASLNALFIHSFYSYLTLFLQLNFGAGDIRFLVYTLFLQIATAREYAADATAEDGAVFCSPFPGRL